MATMIEDPPIWRQPTVFQRRGLCILCGVSTTETVTGKRGTAYLHGDCWERASFD